MGVGDEGADFKDNLGPPDSPQGIHPSPNTSNMLSVTILLLLLLIFVCTHIQRSEVRPQEPFPCDLKQNTANDPRNPVFQLSGYKHTPPRPSISLTLIIKSTAFPQIRWARVSSLSESKKGLTTVEGGGYAFPFHLSSIYPALSFPSIIFQLTAPILWITVSHLLGSLLAKILTVMKNTGRQ